MPWVLDVVVHLGKGLKLSVFEKNPVFKKAGLASLSDIENPGQKAIYAQLELDQNAFLDKEQQFRSEEYKWPRDALHNWSRVWEYPYVYYHLAEHYKTLKKNSMPIVADVGSGVTFFPFSIAKLGYCVLCTDIDLVCERDLALASACVPHSPGTVEFRFIEDSSLPFRDSECDAVYCISVLEHIPEFEKTVAEIARILNPSGLCILTCDINLRHEGGLQLDRDGFARLNAVIDKFFVRICSERTLHPLDILTSKNSPHPLRTQGIMNYGWRIVKQKIIKPFLGRKPGRVRNVPQHLAVMSWVLNKSTDK